MTNHVIIIAFDISFIIASAFIIVFAIVAVEVDETEKASSFFLRGAAVAVAAVAVAAVAASPPLPSPPGARMQFGKN